MRIVLARSKEKLVERKLRAGLVGCGGIAGLRHIPAFMRLKDSVVLEAVCDRNESLAKDVASRFGIPNSYSDSADMLSRESLDIVDICTPPQTHAALAIQAIEAGCHVVLEKPMALNTSDCDLMIEASRKHQVKLCVIHNQLFYPPFIQARKLVAEGAIGDLVGMQIFMSDPRDEMIMRKDYWIHDLPGGLLGETGPHMIYKSLAFIGEVKTLDVYARSYLEHPWAPFDDFRIELEGERASSSIVISYPGRRRASSVDLLGTEGALHLDLLSMLLIRLDNLESMNPLVVALSTMRTSVRAVGGLARNSLSFLTDRGRFFGHHTIIGGFVDSVLHDSGPPVTAEEGRETVRVLEKVISRLKEKYRV